jgi:hypothetical protein
MSIEAMKQALEALEMGLGQVSGDYDTAVQKAIGAVTALRAAIKQAEELADWESVAADQAMTIAMMKIMQEKAQEDNEQLIYDAWRDSEAYGIPMTEEGEKLAEIRLRSFRRGWEYHRFYLQHGDVYMKDYLERQDYDE